NRHGTRGHGVAGKDRRQPAQVREIHLDPQFLGKRLVELQQHRAFNGLRVNRSVEAVRQAGVGIVELEQEELLCTGYGKPLSLNKRTAPWLRRICAPKSRQPPYRRAGRVNRCKSATGIFLWNHPWKPAEL